MNPIQEMRKILIPTEEEQLQAGLPTEEDIEESRNLSKGLKDSSEQRTFDKIIEFQESKIPYWNERRLIEDVPTVSCIIASVIGIIIAVSILNMIGINIDKITAIKIVFAIMLGMFLSGLYLTKLAIIAITIDRLRKNENGSNFRSGIYYIIDYIRYIYEINKYISSVGLPVKRILAWKLAICRDYARLTTSLLYNLYPNSDIYIIKTATHVAAGIKFNGKIHIIDPSFSSPTNTTLILNDWLKKHKMEDTYHSEKKIKTFIILTYKEKTKSRFGIAFGNYRKKKNLSNFGDIQR